MDPGGNVFLALMDEMQRFVVLRWDRSAGWGPATVLDVDEPSTASVLMDADGNATVVWEGVGKAMQVRRYTESGTWMDISPPPGVPVVVNGGTPSGAHVASAPHGQLALLYADPAGHLVANSFAPTTGWTSIGSPTTTGVTLSNVAVLDDGTVLAVWYDSNYSLYFSQAPLGGGWTPQAMVVPNPPNMGDSELQILADRSADAFLVEGQDAHLSDVQWYASGAWTAQQSLTSPGPIAMGNGAVILVDQTLNTVPEGPCRASAGPRRHVGSGTISSAWTRSGTRSSPGDAPEPSTTCPCTTRDSLRARAGRRGHGSMGPMAPRTSAASSGASPSTIRDQRSRYGGRTTRRQT